MDKVRLYLGEIDDPDLPIHYGPTSTLFYVDGYYEEKNKHLFIEVEDKYIRRVNKGLFDNRIPLKCFPVGYIIRYIFTAIEINGEMEERIDTDQAYKIHFHNSFEPVLVFSKKKFKRLMKTVHQRNWRVYRTDGRYTTSWTNE